MYRDVTEFLGNQDNWSKMEKNTSHYQEEYHFPSLTIKSKGFYFSQN
jgi:hypothetical protein